MPRMYRFLVGLARLIVRLFFRSVEVVGVEHIPEDGGGILVSWHPNGIVDPGLILTHFPAQVVFGARDGLFRVPLFGTIIRMLGTVPIARAKDGGSDADRRAANARAMDALAGAVAGGSYSCLFPEGDSHDRPNLLELKTGAARFYYRARQISKAKRPVIIPVGLHYDHKRAFRSNALITFHPPLEIPEELDLSPREDEDPDVGRDRARELTSHIDRVLRNVVHATESWELHHLMHRARKLVRAERALRAGSIDLGPSGMEERILGFARVWAGYYSKLQHEPEQVLELTERVREYDEDMRALGLEDHELDRDPRFASPWLYAILVLQVVLVFLLLPPILFVGYLVNGPTALVVWGASKLGAKRMKDEASIKALLGSLLFPATWAGIGVFAYKAHVFLNVLFPTMPDGAFLSAVTAVALSILGGMLALRYLRVARETVRSVRVRLTRNRRRSAIRRLRLERAELHEALIELSADLDLPGEVTPSGRVRLPADPSGGADQVS
ncbi:MAG: hypothetical protein GY913_35110 [Proteobacteria bacterium]|nr:hypothetical protein [Pseudomonadota bacterium]